MPTSSDSSLLSMNGWPQGVNNRVRETEKGRTEGNRNKSIDPSLSLREAVNVDLTQYGHPIRRKGYTLRKAGFTHSLWSDESIGFGLCVQDGMLTMIESTGLVPLKAVAPYAAVSYCVVNNVVYWSNGTESGQVTAEGFASWGVPRPPKPSVTALTTGTLHSGQYSVALTYFGADGTESGASAVEVVDVVAGMQVTIPGSWPSEAVSAAIYVSQPDGEILYRVGEYLAPTTMTITKDMLGTGMELETQDLAPVPAGHIVRYFNGRIYVVRQDTVVFTEPLRYGLTRPAQGLYMFPSEPLLLEPVTDGLFVGTSEGIYFLAGSDPYDVTQRIVLAHAPVDRAVTRVPGEFLSSSDGDVPVWWGVDGAMVAGLPGGEVVQLSKDRLGVPKFSTGAMVYREYEGMAHVVSILDKGRDEAAMGASDSVVAEVRKAGPKLNY